ncbi:hypothetical protein J4E08_24070 [Sagittula sp. NFXS13]|uniref:hypothetical protein n=1 Tax=Sagittula sp. NFXS13 TaxID=2819095 RepID=UPI0032DFC8B4
MQSKRAYKSKTLAFNLLVGLIGVANEVAPLLDQLIAGGFHADWVPAVRAGLLLVSVVGNAVLRAFTSERVTL